MYEKQSLLWTIICQVCSILRSEGRTHRSSWFTVILVRLTLRRVQKSTHTKIKQIGFMIDKDVLGQNIYRAIAMQQTLSVNPPARVYRLAQVCGNAVFPCTQAANCESEFAFYDIPLERVCLFEAALGVWPSTAALQWSLLSGTSIAVVRGRSTPCLTSSVPYNTASGSSGRDGAAVARGENIYGPRRPVP